MQQRSSETASFESADLAACRALLAGGSKTFFAASYLLPSRVRDPAMALYAFCRLADDAVDLQTHGGPATGTAANPLAALRARVDRAYAGNPLPEPADRAFAAVVARHAIPREVLSALLEGFEWDAKGRNYETFEDLTAYAVRVAGTVGVMMAMLMGARDAERLSRACDLGVAMQLTNIARDVGEDARAGRLYLPRSWLREAGLDPKDWLQNPAYNAALGSVVRRLLDEAELLYRRAESGIAGLPTDCRPGILAARFLYDEIGHQVARSGHDSVTARARVSNGRKAAGLVKALALSPLITAQGPFTTLPAARALIASVAAHGDAASAPEPTVAWWNLSGRFARVVDMFERLERIDIESRKKSPLGSAAAAQ